MNPVARTGSLLRWTYVLPLAAMAIFILLYVLAASRYPGGSWAHPGHAGFSWRHNYLCDLLDTRAVNGALNTGRYWARASLAVLCLGLAGLWYHLPGLTHGTRGFKAVIRYSGLAALGTTVFLSAGTHDLTVRIAGVFGLVGMGCLLVGLWREGQRALGLFGAWCLSVFLLNYAIYETGDYLHALPLIQKVTFASFLAWFAWMDLALMQQETGQSPAKVQHNVSDKQLNP